MAPPRYPHPPDPASAPAARVRLRRRLGRMLAACAPNAPVPAGLPQRLLLIRPDHLGDLLFLGPALRWLRAEHAAATLTLLAGPWAAPALPALAGTYDDLLLAPLPGFERAARAGLRQRWQMLPQWAATLRRRRFDAALIFRPDHWWGAMAAALAGIPCRLGYAATETAPWLTQALLLPREHAAASNLRLAGALLGQRPALDPAAHPLRFDLRPQDVAAVGRLLAAAGVAPDRRLAVIHPGAGAASKLWEAGKWAEVARALAARGLVVLVTGGPGEEALAAQAAAGSDAIDLAGRTDFGQLAALLARADLVLGPDSGPLHLAVAVGAATVHLFGPADPVIFGPWGPGARHVVVQSHWACAGCGRFDWPDLPAHGCVREIEVDRVLQAVADLGIG